MREQRTDSASPADRRSITTPGQRALRARLAAYVLHSKRDPRETTAKARATFLARFEQQVDPDGVLEPAERRRRADHALRAHMTRLALASARSRQSRRGDRDAG
jgi:hypothetical protein